jgi:predicted transposase YbfD/YdcC
LINNGSLERRQLNTAFGLRWKRAPAHTAIRYTLQGLDPQAVEHVFRRHAAVRLDTATDTSRRTISLDGKTLKQSFDNFNDRKAAQVLHAFNLEAGLVLAHIEIDEKSNEIPTAQRLLGELQLANCTVTLDAMHCEKNLEAATAAQAQIIVQLKDNQPTLLKQAEAVCASRDPESSDISVTKGRNRRETRTADVFSTVRARAETEWSSLIKSPPN